MRTYRRIYEQHYGVKIPKGHHIHHKDMDHDNDDPLNLEALHPDEHAKKHGFLNNFIMAQSTACERATIARVTPEFREKMRVKMLGNQYSIGKKFALGYKFTPQQLLERSKRRTGLKYVPRSEEYRKCQSDRRKGIPISPEILAKRIGKKRGPYKKKVAL